MKASQAVSPYYGKNIGFGRTNSFPPPENLLIFRGISPGGAPLEDILNN